MIRSDAIYPKLPVRVIAFNGLSPFTLVSCGKFICLCYFGNSLMRNITNLHFSHCETKPDLEIQQKYVSALFGQLSHVSRRKKKRCNGPSVPYRRIFYDVGFSTMKLLGLFIPLPERAAKPPFRMKQDIPVNIRVLDRVSFEY